MRLAVLAVLLSFPLAPLHAQQSLDSRCYSLGVTQRVIDSVQTALRLEDSVWGPPAPSRVEHCARVKYRSGAAVVLALEGTDERSGGLAVLSADGRQVLQVERYPAARDLVPLGERRLLFTYTKVRELAGAGLYESRYIVLCAVDRSWWLPCLDLPKDQITRVMGGGPSLEVHATITPAPPGLQYRYRYVFDGDVRDSSLTVRMPAVVFGLPRLW